MKERPILFSGPMVRAILEGRKTQTRRVCSEKWLRCLDPDDDDDRWTATLANPYGWPGDRLWVRETWAQGSALSDGSTSSRLTYRADGYCGAVGYDGGGGYARVFHGWLFPDVKDKGPSIGRGKYGPWRPSIHMPRWASRITLEITDVRVQRVQEIGADDARAEGVDGVTVDGRRYVAHRCDLRFGFQQLWDSINAKRGYGWESNPWVWALTFKRAA